MGSDAVHATIAETGKSPGDIREEAISPTETDSSIKSTGSTSPVDTTLDSELKKEPDITEIRMHGQDGSVFSTGQEPSHMAGRPWKTTFLRYGPLAGITGMLIAAGSIVVSLGVLIGSDRAPVAKWGATPSAILAICTAVANQALRFAAFQGFVVAWWFNASRGTTLRQLHVHWRAGTTFAGAFLAGRNMGLIGLACIFSTLVAIDGPLLQKATTIVNAPITNQTVLLNVSMSPEIPTGYSGGWVLSNVNKFAMAAEFNHTLPTTDGPVTNNVIPYFRSDATSRFWNKPWIEDEIVPGFIQGCRGTCTATVRAPAFAQTTCTNREIPVNYTSPVNDATISDANVVPPLSRLGFMISGSLLIDGADEKLNLITGYADAKDCVGTFYMKICTLEAAIGEYDVTIDQGKISLGEAVPRIIALANNTQVNHTMDEDKGWHDSTLAGIVGFYFVRWESSVSWFLHDDSVSGHESGNGTPEAFSIPSANTSDKCQSYENPQEEAVQALNKLMFNVGAVAARENASFLSSRLDPGLSVNTTVTGHVKGNQNVFHTNLHWFAAAAVFEAVCIALILPTYLGFWRLGRRVSFSPIEVAKAFEAPIFTNCNSNSSANDIAKVVGETQIQYGATRSPLGQTKLAFASPSFVEHPVRDSRFDN